MEEKEKGLKTTTVWLMITVALFFDALQILLDFLLMGWLVTIFGSMTFWLWFKLHGYSFMKPKRIAGSLATMLIDAVPVLGWFAWTVAISTFVLKNKIQETVPGGHLAASALTNRSTAKQALQIKQPASLNKPTVKTSKPTNRPYGNAFPKQLENWNEVTNRLNDQQNKTLINSTYKGGMDQYNKDTENQTADRVRMQTAQNKLKDSRTASFKEDVELNKAA